MTSAHQAGILELIFKKKSRGLKSSQEKGNSVNWKGSGVCKEQKGPMWDWAGQRERLWKWTLEDGEDDLSTEGNAKPKRAILSSKTFLEKQLAAEGIHASCNGVARLPKELGDLSAANHSLNPNLAAKRLCGGGSERIRRTVSTALSQRL